MAKSKKNNTEDLIQQLQELLNNKPEATESKSNNKKVVSALKQAQSAIGRAIDLLNGTVDSEATDEAPAAAEVDPEAPYGRKKDGTPKSRPGRAKAEAPTE